MAAAKSPEKADAIEAEEKNTALEDDHVSSWSPLEQRSIRVLRSALQPLTHACLNLVATVPRKEKVRGRREET